MQNGPESMQELVIMVPMESQVVHFVDDDNPFQ